jgi:thiol:disulfide interchange protein
VFVLQCAILSASPSSYFAALDDAQAHNRPLLVLVGADWCPGCQTMKHHVLPQMARTGSLRSVSLAVVDADSEPEVARQLMRGGAIPQLIVYSHKADGSWHREQITGEASDAEVRSLIARAVHAQRPPTELISGPVSR